VPRFFSESLSRFPSFSVKILIVDGRLQGEKRHPDARTTRGRVALSCWRGMGGKGKKIAEAGLDRARAVAGNRGTHLNKEVKTDFNLALKSGRYEQDSDNCS